MPVDVTYKTTTQTRDTASPYPSSPTRRRSARLAGSTAAATSTILASSTAPTPSASPSLTVQTRIEAILDEGHNRLVSTSSGPAASSPQPIVRLPLSARVRRPEPAAPAATGVEQSKVEVGKPSPPTLSGAFAAFSTLAATSFSAAGPALPSTAFSSFSSGIASFASPVVSVFSCPPKKPAEEESVKETSDLQEKPSSRFPPTRKTTSFFSAPLASSSCAFSMPVPLRSTSPSNAAPTPSEPRVSTSEGASSTSRCSKRDRSDKDKRREKVTEVIVLNEDSEEVLFDKNSRKKRKSASSSAGSAVASSTRTRTNVSTAAPKQRSTTVDVPASARDSKKRHRGKEEEEEEEEREEKMKKPRRSAANYNPPSRSSSSSSSTKKTSIPSLRLTDQRHAATPAFCRASTTAGAHSLSTNWSSHSGGDSVEEEKDILPSRSKKGSTPASSPASSSTPRPARLAIEASPSAASTSTSTSSSSTSSSAGRKRRAAEADEGYYSDGKSTPPPRTKKRRSTTASDSSSLSTSSPSLSPTTASAFTSLATSSSSSRPASTSRARRSRSSEFDDIFNTFCDEGLEYAGGGEDSTQRFRNFSMAAIRQFETSETQRKREKEQRRLERGLKRGKGRFEEVNEE